MKHMQEVNVMSPDLLHSFGRFPPPIFSGELSSRHYHPNCTIMNLDLKSNKCLRFPPVNHQLFCEAEYHTGTEADAWLDSSSPTLCKQIMPGLPHEVYEPTKIHPEW